MPILRVTAEGVRDNFNQFLTNSSSNPRQFLANYQNFIEGKWFCKGCLKSIDGKRLKVIEGLEDKISYFHGRDCWNEYKNTTPSLISQSLEKKESKFRDIKLNDSEEFLNESYRNHSELQHNSIYLCHCSFARTFRASQLGFGQLEALELKDII